MNAISSDATKFVPTIAAVLVAVTVGMGVTSLAFGLLSSSMPVAAAQDGNAPGPERSARSTNGEPTVGVLLARSPKRVVLRSPTGQFRLEGPKYVKSDGETKVETHRGTIILDTLEVVYQRKIQGGSPVNVYAMSRGGGSELSWDFKDGHPFRLRADGAAATGVGDKKYEGWIEFVWEPSGDGDGSWALINRLPLERYVMGVLPKEMPASAEPAALEAQAIACRTFALYQMLQKAPTARWHVVDTVMSQAYGGVDSHRSTETAVLQTRGQVLFHRGRLFESLYHSTCGGHTANGAKTFGTPPIDPLTSVKCEYCRNARDTRKGWECKVPESDLRAAVAYVARDSSVKIGTLGPISKVEPIDLQPGRHAAYVRVTHAGGRFEVDTTKLRLALRRSGYTSLRSTSFECRRSGDAFVFAGRGFGHGVGMCQRGAMGMARAKNANAIQILSFYYSAAEVVQLW